MSLLARLLALWAIVRQVLFGRRAATRARLAPPASPPPVEHDPRGRELPESERAEILTAALLFGSAGFAVAFLALYVVYPNTPLLGATAGLALATLAAALMVASLRVVPQVTEVERREPLGEDEEEQRRAADDLRRGAEGVSRRALLTTAAGACGCGLGLAVLAPAASLGPRIQGRLGSSAWRAGRALVDEEDRPLSAGDLEIGSFATAFPQGADKSDLGSPVVVVRVDPALMRPSPERRDWSPEGFVAYSKICTHAGCAVSEFRSPRNPSTAPGGPALVCPCHYSTFDVTRGAKVVFGPAGRPLPQLPLRIDERRILRAAGPLSDLPGAAWWGVGNGG